MRKTRIAALLLAAPLAFVTPASAEAPACYGVADTIWCDPTVDVNGVTWTSTRVCAGSCHYVPTPAVDVERLGVCLHYVDENGTARSGCTPSTNGTWSYREVCDFLSC